MKLKALLLILILPTLTLHAQNTRDIKSLHGMTRLNDTTFIDLFEISFADWNEFCFYHGAERPAPEIIKQKPYYFLIDSQDYTIVRMKIVKVWGKFQPREGVKVRSDSVEDFEAKIKIQRLMDLPIVGITYEQAKKYCLWRTEKYNSIHFGISDSSEYLVKFDLPSIELYEKLFTESDSTYSECASFNYNCTTCQNKKRKDYYFIQPGKDIVPVDAYIPDTNYLYSIRGNVSEMTNTKGIAKGGSYLNYASECNAESVQTYTGPEPWLGFRCIATVTRLKKSR